MPAQRICGASAAVRVRSSFISAALLFNLASMLELAASLALHRMAHGSAVASGEKKKLRFSAVLLSLLLPVWFPSPEIFSLSRIRATSSDGTTTLVPISMWLGPLLDFGTALVEIRLAAHLCASAVDSRVG
ncbi:hypothetical protein V8C42DRAFT_202838 [Trichoderma barbatum]